MKLTEFLFKSPKLNEILKPGNKSQLKIKPHGAKFAIQKNNLRFAAMMLLFFPIKKVLHFCIIKRTIEKNVRPNQVAFPGGEIDKSYKSVGMWHYFK